MATSKLAKNRSAAKKKAKPRIKTAVSGDYYSVEVYSGTVNCPYCGKTNNIYEEEDLPEKEGCQHCEKEFKIKWE